jgi:putative intracellular protease/amidase
VLDCHEGRKVDRANQYSIGNTIIADGHEETTGLVDAMRNEVNAGIEETELKFIKLPGPAIAGSLARAASVHLGSRSLLLSTCTKDQRMPIRARQHRQMIHAALSHLEMLGPDVTPNTLLTSLEDEETIVVGIFDDAGVGGKGRENIERDLDPRPGFRTVRFDGEDIRAGSCDEFDVLVFSGGSGMGQSGALGDDGRERVKRFVNEGGTYIGICAGAYLASSGSKSWLELLDVKTRSPLWARGRANLEVELSPEGRTAFADDEAPPILYANGPVWEAAERDDLEDAEVLAWYRSEVAKNGTPEGLQVDTPALIHGAYGRGVAVAFSCHPEQTEGCEDFVFRAIEAARTRAVEDAAKPETATTP